MFKKIKKLLHLKENPKFELDDIYVYIRKGIIKIYYLLMYNLLILYPV